MAPVIAFSSRACMSSFMKILLRPICQLFAGRAVPSFSKRASIVCSRLAQRALKSGSTRPPAEMVGVKMRKRLKNSLNGLRTEYPARRIRMDSSMPAQRSWRWISSESKSWGALLPLGLMHLTYLGFVWFRSSTSWSSWERNIMLTVTCCFARSLPAAAFGAARDFAPAAEPPALRSSGANLASEKRAFSIGILDPLPRLMMSAWSLSVFFSKKDTMS
mmetsp:Transcript_36057/g.95540  ORF Transcript_36057/g.95540 Transcript_36057/m.95540 type:complete len:218 (-) Transcript_36057:8-661(-)